MRINVHCLHYALLTVYSLSTLVTPVCNSTLAYKGTSNPAGHSWVLRQAFMVALAAMSGPKCWTCTTSSGMRAPRVWHFTYIRVPNRSVEFFGMELFFIKRVQDLTISIEKWYSKLRITRTLVGPGENLGSCRNFSSN